GPAREPAPIVDDGGQVQLALTRLKGNVSLVRGQTAGEGLVRGQGVVTLRPGDRLRTRAGSGGGAFLSLDEGTYELCLDQGTEVVVRGAAGGPVIGLERGRLVAEVSTLPADKRFAVATAQGTFSVLGTVFAVETDAAGSRLTVAEGMVEAHTQHGSATVPAGAAVSVATGQGPGDLVRAESGRLAWARAWSPRRDVLYVAHLDDARSMNGFQGELTSDTTWLASPGALLFSSAGDNRYWGLVARAPAHRLRAFRAAPDLYVQFSVWSEKQTQLLFESLNGTQNKEFKRNLPDAPAGRWKTYTIPVMEFTTYFDPGKHPLREGDLLLDLEVYAGDPGEAFKVVLDEVVVFRKVYD
ncbi:MAG: FecR domain-containing protein, partial [Planctomycetota bacterium]|nr:FecR domain-containing protein [Planctomycetota bacterium]